MADKKIETLEPQYSRCIEVQEKYGLTPFGIMSNQTWHDDPKRLGFLLARYKFVAKMLQGRKHVLEVGCADAFGTRVVQQHVEMVTVSDFDPVFVKDVQERINPEWRMNVIQHDILSGPLQSPEGTEPFDAVFALDLLEHIPQSDEEIFIKNLCDSMTAEGVVIVGSPTIHSQPYASPPSRAGHVNCKDYEGTKSLLEKYFHNVFVFSMNDEIVHTGFSQMANYFISLACTRRFSS